jgi:hypothetical protein
MMNPDSKRPITIEDLLRLKRAERPPAEFWNEFDRALRAKQLAALVEKRPWWQTMPRVFSGFRRYHIPIGASAIIAVTFFAFRENSATSAAQREQSSVQPTGVASTTLPAVAREVRTEGVATSAKSEPRAQNVYAAGESARAAVPPTVMASDGLAPSNPTRILPLISAPSTELMQEELSPSARAIAENLASVRGTEPVLGRSLLASTGGLEARSNSRITVEPLQQIMPPSDRRRSNLLTAMVSMASLETPMRTNDRTVSRLSQEELYDRFHRFDARASSLNMKF